MNRSPKWDYCDLKERYEGKRSIQVIYNIFPAINFIYLLWCVCRVITNVVVLLRWVFCYLKTACGIFGYCCSFLKWENHLNGYGKISVPLRTVAIVLKPLQILICSLFPKMKKDRYTGFWIQVRISYQKITNFNLNTKYGLVII